MEQGHIGADSMRPKDHCQYSLVRSVKPGGRNEALFEGFHQGEVRTRFVTYKCCGISICVETWYIQSCNPRDYTRKSTLSILQRYDKLLYIIQYMPMKLQSKRAQNKQLRRRIPTTSLHDISHYLTCTCSTTSAAS